MRRLKSRVIPNLDICRACGHHILQTDGAAFRGS